MSANVVHPAELERRLQERLQAARSKHDPAYRSHGRASRRGFRRGSAGLAVGLVLALTATGVFADGGNLDVQVTDKADYAVDTTTDGAIVEYIGDDSTTFGSAGSGVFESFLQTQDDPSEEGYNTDGDSEFDTGSSPTFNHAILVSAIPTVECESLDESESTTGLCWELFADINDSNANDPDAAQIQLTDLEIWLTDDAEITGYDQGGTGFGSDADLVYDFEGTILINDVNQGSGRGDLRYLIPLEGIVLPDNCEFGSAACTTYFVVYTEWGDPADGDYKSDSGFEEWKVKTYPSLQIVKNTVGGDTTFDFAVTGDPTDPPDTSPSITTSGGTGSTPAYVIEEGTYTIDELGPPAGWTLTGAVCSFNGGAAQAYTEGADLEIDDDDHVICTFTNVRMGTIRIIKDAIPNDAQDFDFSATGLSPTSFVLDDDADGTLSNLHTYSNVLPGTYTVTETGETGWDLTDLDCDDDASTTPSTDTGATATINVDPGETVTCTYENTKRGTVRIIKDAIPNDAQDFDFSATGLSPTSFVLDDDADGTLSNLHTYSNVLPGTYTVTETGETGWDLTDLDCDDDASTTPSTDTGATATINVDPGETVTCTYENTKRGTIRIIKDAIPNDAQDFDFSATGLSPTSFVLDDDADGTLSNLHTYSNVLPGTYTVTETGETGWDLTDLDCDDDASTTPSTDTGATATINVDPGETVTCTYENSKRPTIIVRKVTTGTAGGPFTFTTTGGNGFTGPFDLTTLAVNTPVSQSFEIAAAGIGGDYTVTESAMPAGFVLTDVDCVVTTAGAPGTTTGQDVATKTGSIFDLSAGTTVTCTFVNSGALTTRTQGFWSTHSWLVELIWSPTGGTIDTFIHDGMTDAERTLCPGQEPLTVEEVMGGFWSNIAKQTDGDKRSKLDQARMQLAQQLLAAILNNQLFGSSPSGITIDQAKAAYCGTDIAAIKAAASAMAAFNESGDAGVFTPGGSADAKHARAIADREYWDDLP